MRKFLILITLLFLAVSSYYFIPKTVSDRKIKIKCSYMAYACGNCYPQYHVKQIVIGKNKATEMILDTDLHIEFNDEKIKKKLISQTSKCMICYDFYFIGELKKTPVKGYYFISESVEYKLKDTSCCIQL